jgi:hypothetical protein
MKKTVILDVSMCLAETGRRFRGAYCFHHQGDEHLSKLVTFDATRHNIPEDSYFYTYRCENLKAD